MKKVLSLVAVCVLLVGMMACGVFSASAATPKEEIIAALKAGMPAQDLNENLPMIENVLSQIEVTAEQAESVVANINAVNTQVKYKEGQVFSLHAYTAADQKIVLSNLDEACATLGLTYELVAAKNPAHKGDVECIIYKLDDSAKGGKIVVGRTDPDVKKTNAPETNVVVMVALISTLALAGVAAVFGKKLVASR